VRLTFSKGTKTETVFANLDPYMSKADYAMLYIVIDQYVTPNTFHWLSTVLIYFTNEQIVWFFVTYKHCHNGQN